VLFDLCVLCNAESIVVSDSLPQVVIKARVDDGRLVLIECVAEGVVSARTSLLIQLDLVLDGAELLEFVFGFGFVPHVSRCEIVSAALANVDLAVAGRLRAAKVRRHEGAATRRVHDVLHRRHAILRSVLVGALRLDCRHVARGEKSFFVVAVRYSILVVVDAVVGHLVVRARRRFVRAQDCLPRLRVHYVWLPGHTQRKAGVISRDAVRQLLSVEVWLVVLAGTSRVLKGLECLAQLLSGDARHAGLLRPELALELVH